MTKRSKLGYLAGVVSLLLGVGMAVLFSSPRHKSVSPEYYEESVRLTRLGNEAVDSGKLGDAETYAEQLKQRGYIGAWEVRARIHTARENHEQALRVIDEGLALVPDYEVMWVQRGNALSDLERWEESGRSYDRARTEGAETSDVDFNEGLMNLRRGEHEVALGLLRRCLKSKESKPYSDRARTLEVYCLARLDRDLELQAILEASEPTARYDLLLEASTAHLDAGRRSRALPLALGAAKLDRKREEALWHVREAENRFSEKALLWKLITDGKQGSSSFMAPFQVVAESADQALGFARRLEPDDARLVSIEEVEKGERKPDVPLGVYQRTGRIYYVDTEDSPH